MDKASENEIIDFLRSRGISLKGEALNQFEQKLQDAPVSKQMLNQSRKLAGNKHFATLLDHSFTHRIEKFEKTLEDNPFFQLVKTKRGSIKKENSEDKDILFLRHDLAQIFFNDRKWEDFDPTDKLYSGKLIVKVWEPGRKKPFIGCLIFTEDDFELQTTRRRLYYKDIIRMKLKRLISGESGAEKTKNKSLQKAFYEYITGFLKKY